MKQSNFGQGYSPGIRDSHAIYGADMMSIEEGLGHGPSDDGPKTGSISTQFNIMNTVMGVAI
jgi:amino acid permease